MLILYTYSKRNVLEVFQIILKLFDTHYKHNWKNCLDRGGRNASVTNYCNE